MRGDTMSRRSIARTTRVGLATIVAVLSGLLFLQTTTVAQNQGKQLIDDAVAAMGGRDRVMAVKTGARRQSRGGRSTGQRCITPHPRRIRGVTNRSPARAPTARILSRHRAYEHLHKVDSTVPVDIR
jgi:hypothetical protein